jgi:predicted DNA-binding ribbon-helix-helix protein
MSARTKKMESVEDNVPAFDSLTPRIIQFQGKRSCIRLEDVYWGILEDAARAKKLKFNELVHTFYHDPRGERNKTAFLRCQAVEWLSGQVDVAHEQLRLKQTELRSILRVTIQPAIVFSKMQSVSRHNQAFRDWITEHLGPKAINLDYSKLRISFRRSYNAIMEVLAQGGGSALAEQVTILMPGYVFPIRINIVKLDKQDNDDQLFLGIINTDS